MNWAKLTQIDRRVIFIAVALAILIPLIFPVHMPMGAQRVTKNLYASVEAVDRTRDVLLLSSDYAPQTEAENHPMAIAILRHCFARRLPVLINALYVEGAPLLDMAMNQVMDEFNARAKTNADSIIYGRDVVYLGWQPPPIVPILSMGRSISGIYPVDYRGNPTDSLEVMKRVHNYDQIGLVVGLTSSVSPLWYVMYAQTKFGVKVGAGCTAVSAPDFYPYCRSGQLTGMMAGMKGAAEYEELVGNQYGVAGRRRATEGMASQSAAHLLMMAFVIIGNIAYFATRRKP